MKNWNALHWKRWCCFEWAKKRRCEKFIKTTTRIARALNTELWAPNPYYIHIYTTYSIIYTNQHKHTQSVEASGTKCSIFEWFGTFVVVFYTFIALLSSRLVCDLPLISCIWFYLGFYHEGIVFLPSPSFSLPLSLLVLILFCYVENECAYICVLFYIYNIT